MGTIRSFSPDDVREPYRAMAAYIDRVAKPQDRVLVLSFIGQPAISSMLHTPRPVLTATPLGLLPGPAGPTGTCFSTITSPRCSTSATPHPQGLTLIGHKHYRGSLPTELLIYHRS